MTDPIMAMVSLLLESPAVGLLTKGNVYGEVFAPERVRDLPCAALVVRGTPGQPDARLDTIRQQRVEIVSIAESSEEALRVSRAAFDVLQAVDRRVTEGVFIHNVQTAGGVEQRLNGETMHHEAVRAAVITFDETEV
jgi:hypothetical protein